MNTPASNSTTNSRLRREALRKSLHLPGLLIPYLATKSLVFVWILLVGLSFIYGFGEYLRCFKAKSSYNFHRWIGKFRRDDDMDLAPIYLALGLGIAVTFYPFRASMLAAFFICVCDGCAAMMGMKFGRRKIPRMSKTYLGSLAFFIPATLGAMVVMDWKEAITLAFFSTLVEAFSIRGLDNLWIPIFSGGLATWLLLH